MKDPIVHTLSVFLIRGLWFLSISAVLPFGLWYLLMTEFFYVNDKWLLAQRALSPALYPTETSLVVGCIVISVLTTTVLFMSIALWWRGRVDAHQHRGARVIDLTKNGG